ncbi:MAG: HAD family hydrolase [Chloroflexota bacterium]
MAQGQRPYEAGIAFLLDVDNTLLDNDRLKADLAQLLEDTLGDAASQRFWEIYERVRSHEDYVDFPETVREWTEESGNHERGSELRELLGAIDFRSYLYPHVFDAIAHLRTIGTVVILSDGDPVFQPHKIRQSGLEAAVDRVLIFVHKEQELPQVFAAVPAVHYVMVDDKPRILAALERECRASFTTVLVLQGKYAHQGEVTPTPDYTVPGIASLMDFTIERFAADRPAKRP